MKQVLTLIGICFFQQAAFSQGSPLPAKKHKLVVVAHRGDHTESPENTLTAFRNAIKNEVDYVEIDLRTSKDGKLVIMHDATINRMTNGKGAVRDFTLAELKQQVVADKGHPDWKTETIPTFEEVLALCRDKIYIYLDFKEASVEASMLAIKKYGMEKSIVVYINSEQQFRDWSRLAPEMPLMVSLPDSVRSVQALTHFLQSWKISVLDGSHDDYTLEMVQAAKKLNMPICPDIQSPHEGPAEWSEALFKGFSGLQTDHPKLLVDFLQEKGLR